MTASLDYSVLYLGMNSTPCNSSFTGTASVSNEPDGSHSVVRLNSPTYSIYSDGEYCHTYSESVSSVDGSSRYGSDRFHLGGDFSSCDSDTIVSNSSDYSECGTEKAEPLLKLKTLHKKLVRITKLANEEPIVISDSSDEDVPPISPPLLLVPPEKPLSLSSNDLTLVVNISLDLITLPNSTPVVNRTKKAPVKLALSHFATSKKKTSKSSSSDDLVNTITSTPRTPLSLKLKKSAVSNLWHPVAITPTLNATNTSTITTVRKELFDSSIETGVKEEGCSNANKTMDKDDRQVIATPTQDTSSATPNSSSKTTLEPVSISDVFLSSSGDEDYDQESLSSFSLSTSTTTSTSESLLRGKVSSRRTSINSNAPTNTKQARNNKSVDYTFSFEDVFSCLLPELTVVDNELRPIHSLSVNGLSTVPTNHPIHKWRVGRPTGNPRAQQKRRKRKIVKTRNLILRK